MSTLGTIFLFIVVVMVLGLIKTAMQSRQHTALTDRRFCKQCGATYPHQARFCGRCGKSFGP